MTQDDVESGKFSSWGSWGRVREQVAVEAEG
jgi:hypothetical protein